MCWNKEVSLNTFLFSGFVLLLIYYNNTYTKYTVAEFNSIWVYLFFCSFIFMQLIEYFIWKNINNAFYNSFYSILAVILIIIQPIASLMLLHNATFRWKMIAFYMLAVFPFCIYRFATKHVNTTISAMGHLKWNFLTYSTAYEPFYIMVWLFFFLFSLFYNQDYYGFIFGLAMLLIIVYNYAKDGSFGSMWCWIVNSIMIYYAVYLLIYLPFIEKYKLC